MRKTEAFPSKWLKADDLMVDGEPITPVLTIAAIHSTTFERDGESRAVRALKFKETDKELLLNVGNWDSIEKITGQDDDENWIGYEIKLYRMLTDSPNGKVWGVRVAPKEGWDNFKGPKKPKAAAKSGGGLSAPKATPEPEEVPADDLPF